MHKKLLALATLCAVALNMHAASYMQQIGQWVDQHPKTALGLGLGAGFAAAPTFSYLKTYATPDRLKALIPSAQIAQEWGMKCTQWVTENRWKSAALGLGAYILGRSIYTQRPPRIYFDLDFASPNIISAGITDGDTDSTENPEFAQELSRTSCRIHWRSTSNTNAIDRVLVRGLAQTEDAQLFKNSLLTLYKSLSEGPDFLFNDSVGHAQTLLTNAEDKVVSNYWSSKTPDKLEISNKRSATLEKIKQSIAINNGQERIAAMSQLFDFSNDKDAFKKLKKYLSNLTTHTYPYMQHTLSTYNAIAPTMMSPLGKRIAELLYLRNINSSNLHQTTDQLNYVVDYWDVLEGLYNSLYNLIHAQNPEDIQHEDEWLTLTFKNLNNPTAIHFFGNILIEMDGTWSNLQKDHAKQSAEDYNGNRDNHNAIKALIDKLHGFVDAGLSRSSSSSFAASSSRGGQHE